MAIACAALFVLGRAVCGADESPQATAIAYERGPFAREFAIRAVLSLDRIPMNQSWYSTYLSFVEARDARTDQPFVQVGLMRWSGNRFRLSAFVALGSGAKGSGFDDLGVLAEGPHEVALRASDGRAHVLIDGHERRTIALSKIFMNPDRVYAQIAAAVSQPGDSIRARLTHVEVRHDRERTFRPYRGGCRYDDHGVHMKIHGDTVTATGRFAADEPNSYAGCDKFF
jgi:hypothetical protein